MDEIFGRHTSAASPDGHASAAAYRVWPAARPGVVSKAAAPARRSGLDRRKATNPYPPAPRPCLRAARETPGHNRWTNSGHPHSRRSRLRRPGLDRPWGRAPEATGGNDRGRSLRLGQGRFGSQAKQGRGCVDDPYVSLRRGRDVDLDGMVGDVAEQDREPSRVASDPDDYVVAWIVGGVRERQALSLVLVAESRRRPVRWRRSGPCGPCSADRRIDPIGRRRSSSALSFDRLRRCRFLSLPGTYPS
jgi:hypothetical protein